MRILSSPRVLGLAVTVALATAGTVAHAEGGPSPTDRALSESLFREGRKLVREGKYEEACPKFAESQRLGPGIGVLLNLGDCYERIGKTVSAWGAFREAYDRAVAAKDAERAAFAERRADALEGHLPRIIIRLSGGDAKDVEVSRDGEPLSLAALGEPIPVDPGTHTIAAKGKGRRPYSATIELGTEGGDRIVSIQLLPEHGTLAVGEASSSAMADERVSSGSFWNWQRYSAVAAGALGVVGIGLGTGYTVAAIDTRHAYENGCPTKDCYDDPLKAKAESQRGIAVGSFVAAGLLLGGATVLWLTAPTPARAAAIPHVEVANGGATLEWRGAW